MPDDAQRSTWCREGYLIVRGAVGAERVRELKLAVDELLERDDFKRPLRWVGEARRLPDVIPDLLSADKYHPAFGTLR